MSAMDSWSEGSAEDVWAWWTERMGDVRGGEAGVGGGEDNCWVCDMIEGEYPSEAFLGPADLPGIVCLMVKDGLEVRSLLAEYGGFA
jgi:hypothetical protein